MTLGTPLTSGAEVGITTPMEENPTTQELRIRQLHREKRERTRTAEAPTEDAAEAHARRAEKNAYLRRRLEERAEAEREAAPEPSG